MNAAVCHLIDFLLVENGRMLSEKARSELVAMVDRLKEVLPSNAASHLQVSLRTTSTGRDVLSSVAAMAYANSTEFQCLVVDTATAPGSGYDPCDAAAANCLVASSTQLRCAVICSLEAALAASTEQDNEATLANDWNSGRLDNVTISVCLGELKHPVYVKMTVAELRKPSSKRAHEPPSKSAIYDCAYKQFEKAINHQTSGATKAESILLRGCNMETKGGTGLKEPAAAIDDDKVRLLKAVQRAEACVLSGLSDSCLGITYLLDNKAKAVRDILLRPNPSPVRPTAEKLALQAQFAVHVGRMEKAVLKNLFHSIVGITYGAENLLDGMIQSIRDILLRHNPSPVRPTAEKLALQAQFAVHVGQMEKAVLKNLFNSIAGITYPVRLYTGPSAGQAPAEVLALINKGREGQRKC